MSSRELPFVNNYVYKPVCFLESKLEIWFKREVMECRLCALGNGHFRKQPNKVSEFDPFCSLFRQVSSFLKNKNNLFKRGELGPGQSRPGLLVVEQLSLHRSPRPLLAFWPTLSSLYFSS